MRLEAVHNMFAYLRQHVTTDISSANIVISGNSVVLCRTTTWSTWSAAVRACSTCPLPA